jgi:hypothetical protein
VAAGWAEAPAGDRDISPGSRRTGEPVSRADDGCPERLGLLLAGVGGDRLPAAEDGRGSGGAAPLGRGGPGSLGPCAALEAATSAGDGLCRLRRINHAIPAAISSTATPMANHNHHRCPPVCVAGEVATTVDGTTDGPGWPARVLARAIARFCAARKCPGYAVRANRKPWIEAAKPWLWNLCIADS